VSSIIVHIIKLHTPYEPLLQYLNLHSLETRRLQFGLFFLYQVLFRGRDGSQLVVITTVILEVWIIEWYYQLHYCTELTVQSRTTITLVIYNKGKNARVRFVAIYLVCIVDLQILKEEI